MSRGTGPKPGTPFAAEGNIYLVSFFKNLWSRYFLGLVKMVDRFNRKIDLDKYIGSQTKGSFINFI
ncbi:MAG TPA: hypothetical protein VFR65_03260 [Nitrososphaeraceae archaeon]|nr:hypothetical protein [Nitrososphaeraceae archaeon]